MNELNELERDYKRHLDAAMMGKEVDDFLSCYQNFDICAALAKEISDNSIDKKESDRYLSLSKEAAEKAESYLQRLRLSPSELAKLKKRKLPKGFDKFIGEDRIKEYLNKTLIPFWKENRMKDREKSAILFYGPEGGSKSVFIQSMIHELNATPYYLNPMSNYSPFGDNTKEQMLHLFKMAEEKNNVVFYITKPVCYFPNEKSKINKATFKLFNKLICKEIKRVRKLNLNILFVASTSCPDKMNPSCFTKGMFDDLIRLHHPDRYTRKAMMDDRLKGIVFENPDAIQELVPLTHGFIPKEVSRLCRRIRYVSELYRKDGKSGIITKDMLERIMKELGPCDDIGFNKTVKAFEKSLPSSVTITNDL